MSALGQKQDIGSPLSHWHMAIRGFMVQQCCGVQMSDKMVHTVFLSA